MIQSSSPQFFSHVETELRYFSHKTQNQEVWGLNPIDPSMLTPRKLSLYPDIAERLLTRDTLNHKTNKSFRLHEYCPFDLYNVCIYICKK